MSIDDMKPGYALDALVAEKVLGWRLEYHTFGSDLPGGPFRAYGYDSSGRHLCGDFPHFSTDIAAAWQVVEKFAADNWEVSVGWSIADNAWLCGIGLDGHGWDMELADTALHAICLAALKAMEATSG